MLGRVIFGLDHDFQYHLSLGIPPFIIRLQRQVSYFGDRDGINDLLAHFRDDEFGCQILSAVWDERCNEDVPYKAFNEWPEVVNLESLFKDLIRQFMSLGPKRRVTVRQALEHPWFADV